MGGSNPAPFHIREKRIMENLISKHMRLVQAGYQNFTGPIGPFEFVDGVSVEAIPLFQRDRLAVAFQLVEINDDGSEQGAGPAERLLREAHIRAESTAPLARQTVEEKSREDLAMLLKGEKIPTLRSAKNLETVVDKAGIAGLRLIAADWKVRSKSIPDLIKMILAAQKTYVAERVAILVKSGVAEADAKGLFVLFDDVAMPVHPKDREADKIKDGVNLSVTDAPAVIETPVVPTPEPVVEPVAPVEPSLVEQAQSGDLAAALNEPAE